MIYLFHGDDDFTIEETLASIKNGIGIDDLRDVNITEVEGESISIDSFCFAIRESGNNGDNSSNSPTFKSATNRVSKNKVGAKHID